jgi:N-formylglutamate amidohydrolase
MLHWLGRNHPTIPLILTVPHAGERIPPEARWLKTFPSEILLTDVDRFVQELYTPSVTELPLPLLYTEVHRYAADLNRYPGDVDRDSVEGSTNASGAFTKGFHWVATTTDHRLITRPIAQAIHDELVRRYHDPFHAAFGERRRELRAKFAGKTLYHLDCHSMPSTGTDAHADSGRQRAEVVISDCEGKSAGARYKDLVIGAFEAEGFEVAYNWPYKGGRITQRYGKPAQGEETIQIELNRKLYMNERTFERTERFRPLQRRLARTIGRIAAGLGI